jgi:hypothetical protein
MGKDTGAPGNLFTLKETLQVPAAPSHHSKRFRGDLVLYFIALFIWAIGSIWFIVRFVNKIFL